MIKRWWWVGAAALGLLLGSSALLAPWVEGQIQADAANVAQVERDRVLIHNGTEVQLVGFTDQAELDEAVLAIEADNPALLVEGSVGALASAAVDPAESTEADQSSEADESAEAEDSGETETESDAADDGQPSQEDVVDQLNRLFAASPIVFEASASAIPPDSLPLLEDAALLLTENPQVGTVAVVGHTDTIGDEADNQELSAERAAAVVAELVALGVDETRLEAIGRGESEPIIAVESTFDELAQNRRIEWEIVDG